MYQLRERARAPSPSSMDVIVGIASGWNCRQLEIALTLQMSQRRPKLQRTNQARSNRGDRVPSPALGTQNSHAPGHFCRNHSFVVLVGFFAIHDIRRVGYLTINLDDGAAFQGGKAAIRPNARWSSAWLLVDFIGLIAVWLARQLIHAVASHTIEMTARLPLSAQPPLSPRGIPMPPNHSHDIEDIVSNHGAAFPKP